ncbi:MAG: hypothetical protein HRT72_06615 [Flavobacteriales bacterium]|nr:hypothetical protein [Flavobacteriales bacterium]
MKSLYTFLLILLAACPILSFGQTSSALMGKWKLVSIDKYGIDLPTGNKDYFLDFQKETIQFTVIPNQCYQAYHIDGNTIVIEGEKGCEKKVEENLPENILQVNAEIDYSGKFIIKDGILTITNERASYKLVRK